MAGKAMVVCMSRRICIDLYRELVRLRPAWRDDDDTRGALKVVMTGQASDPPDWQAHIGNKARREALAKRFRDPADPLRMVLVRDMWLTGFDAPSLHTMYVDKPMRGHELMQAIARVNRVLRVQAGRTDAPICQECEGEHYGEVCSRGTEGPRFARIAFTTHGQPRPSTRCAGPPLRSGPSGDCRG